MLDALKVLFILTGASTYLVTKYVKVGLEKNGTSVIGSSTGSPLSPETIQLLEKYKTEFKMRSSASASSSPDATNNNNNNALAGGGSSDLSAQIWKSIKDKSNNKLINDKAGDGNTASNWTSSSSETNDNDGGEVVKYIKPTYVIKLIEEDDKSLPKLLLQVAAAPSSASTFTSSASNKQRKIIYFLSDASLSSLSDKFFVNSSTGELFVLKPLDRDQPTGKPEWAMSILAKYEQEGEPFGFADVVVHLTDINDNTPIFTRNIFFVNVSEAIKPNQVIIVVTANDFDDPESPDGNGRINYSIKYQNKDDQMDEQLKDQFHIDPITGQISLSSSSPGLNRETKSQHILQVIASDGGGLSSTATVIIKLIDVNDSPPRFFRKNISVELNQDHPIDEPIAVLSVEDEDETNSFDCQLMPDKKYDQREFKLLTNIDGSCVLKRSERFNFTNTNLMRNLTICVSDMGPNIDYLDPSGRHSDCAWVRVTVNAPSLMSSLLSSSSEIKTFHGQNDSVISYPDLCNGIQCHNGARCGPSYSGLNWQCFCLEGYQGSLCQDEIEASSPSSSSSFVIRLTSPLVIVILICVINALVLILIIIIYTQRKTKNNKRNGRNNNKQQQQQQKDKQKSKDQINNKVTEGNTNMNSMNMNDPGSTSILMSSLMSNQHPNVILNDNNYYYHHNYTSAIPSSSSSLDHNYLSSQSKLQQPDVIVHQTSSSSSNPKLNPTPSPGHRQVLPGVSVIESMKKQINFSMNIDCSNCLCDDCSSCYNSNDDSQQHSHQQKSCHQMSVNPNQANVTYCSYCLSSTPSPIDGGSNPHHVNCLGELKNLSNDNSQQQQTILINGVIVGINELSPTRFPGRITTV